MSDNKVPKLQVSRAEASEMILSQIDRGKELLKTQISSEEEFDNLKSKTWKWIDYNKTLFGKLFDESPLPEWHGHIVLYIRTRSFAEELADHMDDISRWTDDLESIYDRLELYEELPNTTQQPPSNDNMNNKNKKIFIGHGRSLVWRELKDFIEDELKRPTEEFNRIPPAGYSTKERLEEMLEVSCMAFLVMTGEDEQADGSLRARDNVIHEAGLFQGKIGFKRAIVLLEKGCEEFSNIEGLGQIRFPKGNLRAIFEDIRKVLKRESII